MDYLNDIEKAEVEKFLDNKTALEAVRKVLLSGVYFNGVMEAGEPADPLQNFILGRFTNQVGMTPPSVSIDSDEALGSKLRSIIDAVSMVESGFAELEKCRKVVPEKKEIKNKGI